MKEVVLFLVFIAFSGIAAAQDKKEQAYQKGLEAVKLEDQGKYEEAIKLLKEAQKLDPDFIDYPYELAYAYAAMEDYAKAIKTLEKLKDHQKIYDQVYQLLGNCYDMMGNSEKAIEVYDEGLERFPKSGKLFLEKGNVFWGKKEYSKALPFYEKGIAAEPTFPSNYYRATLLYCSSTEEVWGMIYGEIFMNLERNTGRTAEISKLLYDTYTSQITKVSDSSYSISFSKSATISLDDLSNPESFKLPFGIGVYEPTMLFSLVMEKEINLASLDRIRTNFVNSYFENKQNEKYPNVLFDFQKKLVELGYMEAYNHWILMKGDEAAFDEWYAANQEKFDAFAEWFNANPIEINNHNYFHSGL